MTPVVYQLEEYRTNTGYSKYLFFRALTTIAIADVNNTAAIAS
jgi:hypothetical protein